MHSELPRASGAAYSLHRENGMLSLISPPKWSTDLIVLGEKNKEEEKRKPSDLRAGGAGVM